MRTDSVSAANDLELADSVRNLGTPAYYYSLPLLRSRIKQLKNAFGGFPTQLLFATMANDYPPILKEISKQQVGVCVNSMRHLDLALQNGFTPDRIHFTSTGTPISDMLKLQSMGITSNLDSVSQVEQWCRLAHGARAGIRINAASLTMNSKADRIGMEVGDIPHALKVAERHGGAIDGLHVYAGTNFQKADDLLPTIAAMFHLAAQFPNLDYINIGGGIGIDYTHSAPPFDLSTFGNEVTSLAQKLSVRRRQPIRLLFEPGRGLVGESGRFIVRVTDIKLLHREVFVTVDASIAVFPRPFHHPESLHRVRLLGPSSDAEDREVTIVGRTTFSRDILGRSWLPASVSIDDLLVFDDAGAYCQSMSSRFLGQSEPNYIVADD